jgi:simple sugar transport system permease protein
VSGALPSVITGVMLFFIIGSEFFINYQLFHTRKGQRDEILKAAAESGKEAQK